MSAPTSRQLIDDFRREVDDPLIPGTGSDEDADSLWKTYELLGYLDEAQQELARRTLKLTKSTEIDFVSEEPLLEYPEDLVQPRRASLKNARTSVVFRNLNEIEEQVAEDYGIRSMVAWRDNVGRPQILITDYEDGFWRWVPIPAEADTLILNYYRTAETVKSGAVKLELGGDAREKRAMLHWMKKLAYEKQDADAMDLQRAAGFERQFEIAVRTLIGETMRRTRRPGTTGYGGY